MSWVFCKCVILKNVGSLLYLDLKKGFVVAAISKVIYKFVSTLFVIVWVRANATEAKCKAKRNRAFGMLRVAV